MDGTYRTRITLEINGMSTKKGLCPCLAGKGSGVRIPDAPPRIELRNCIRTRRVPGFRGLDHNFWCLDHNCDHLPDDHLLDRGKVRKRWPRDQSGRSTGCEIARVERPCTLSGPPRIVRALGQRAWSAGRAVAAALAAGANAVRVGTCFVA